MVRFHLFYFVTILFVFRPLFCCIVVFVLTWFFFLVGGRMLSALSV